MAKQNKVEAISTTPVEEQVTYNIKELLEQFKTKSAVIRHLHSEGLSRGAIVKVFTEGGEKMIYQHVRNVLITPLKKEG